jgi:hypothetical protein
MHADEVGINRLSEHIIGCAFRVFNTLGLGFLEQVYENTLARELRKAGPTVAQQQGIGAHTAQCLNYLKATGLHLCLLLNFGRARLEIRRMARGL